MQQRGVTKKLKSKPTVCEDFFHLVVDGHILHAVMSTFGMESLEDTPSDRSFANFLNHSMDDRVKLFFEKTRMVIDKHFNFCREHPSSDSVLSYAEETLSLGLFLLEFTDAIHEGDGYRILRCWKYLL